LRKETELQHPPELAADVSSYDDGTKWGIIEVSWWVRALHPH